MGFVSTVSQEAGEGFTGPKEGEGGDSAAGNGEGDTAPLLCWKSLDSLS